MLYATLCNPRNHRKVWGCVGSRSGIHPGHGCHGSTVWLRAMLHPGVAAHFLTCLITADLASRASRWEGQ